MQPDIWVVRLACGHVARLGTGLPAGGYVTCLEERCQGQRRVVSCCPAPVVYVQDDLGLEVAS